MPSRFETIAGWANDLNWRQGAELGVLAGQSLIYLLEHCPQLHMIGVDVWSKDWVELGTKSEEKCFCVYCNATRTVRRARTPREHMTYVSRHVARIGRCKLLVMPTHEAAAVVEEGTLDFVFIDASHAFEAVVNDIMTWAPKLKHDGWVIGHDWNMESVRNAVKSIYAEESIRREDDHLWYIPSHL